MDDTSTPCGVRLQLTDGGTLAVETAEGLVQLVTRDEEERVLSGLVLAPSEAQRLGQLIISAAFQAKATSA